VEIRQETRYPWDGAIRLTVTPSEPRSFPLNVRIPGWAVNRPIPGDLYRYDDGLAPKIKLSVNGAAQPLVIASNGFVRIDRKWSPGDVVALDLEMPVRTVVAHPAVKADKGRFAVERGPLVYCAEGADNGGAVLDKVPGRKVSFSVEDKPALLGGIVAIRIQPDGPGDVLNCIPYYAWCHRGANEMRVWHLTQPEERLASHCWQADSVEACFDGKEPRSSNDGSIPRFTWWPCKGSTEWVVRLFEKPTPVSQASLYWFDDTGSGGCRTPAQWRLFYRDGAQWKSVEDLTGCGVETNRYNTASFKSVTTTALKLEADLKPGFSAGILEWK
jgi:hypothetical protein